jgi:hypothetical protein
MSDAVNKLVRAASGSKKPKKAEAQRILRELAEWLEKHNDLHPDTLADLAALYTYFMPPKRKKARTLLEWVALAAGRKNPHKAFNYVYVDNAHAVATDGHRLHFVPLSAIESELAPGFYCPRTLHRLYEPEDFQFPDWQHIVPEVTPQGQTSHNVQLSKLTPFDHAGEPALRLPGTASPFALRYLLDAWNHEHDAERDVYVPDPEHTCAVLIRYDAMRAVIMPRRN